MGVKLVTKAYFPCYHSFSNVPADETLSMFVHGATHDLWDDLLYMHKVISCPVTVRNKPNISSNILLFIYLTWHTPITVRLATESAISGHHHLNQLFGTFVAVSQNKTRARCSALWNTYRITNPLKMHDMILGFRVLESWPCPLLFIFFL